MRTRALAQDVATCIAFFTRIPVPFAWQAPERFSQVLWAAPLAGVLVGLLVAGTCLALLGFGFAAGPAAAAALGVGLLVTGALHEDGLADVADAFGGGQDAEAKLRILKDSRNGTFGTLALCLGVLLRWTALAALAGSPSLLAAVVAAHAASRALFVPFTAVVEPAAQSGLATGLGDRRPAASLAALLLGALALLLCGPLYALVAAGALVFWSLVLAVLTRRQIGGHTGDVLGTLQQGAEILLLLLASVLLV